MEDDLAGLRVGLGMHVRVREVALVQRDEVAAVADVLVEGRDGLPAAADRGSGARLLAGAQRVVHELDVVAVGARMRRRRGRRADGTKVPATKRSGPRTVFVPSTSKSAYAR